MGNNSYWDNSRKGFYEVWYFTFVDPATGLAFWLRSTLLKTVDKQSRSGSLWFSMFHPEDSGKTFNVYKEYGPAEVSSIPGEFNVSIGDSLLKEGYYNADFESDGHKISWSLEYSPRYEDIWLVPNIVRRSGIPKADVCVPNVDINLYGSISVNGEKFNIDDAPGGQSHHWGYHYAPAWLWGHCNAFEDRPDAWIEILSVRQGRADVSIPVAMMQLQTDDLKLGTISPVHMVRSRAQYANGIWRYTFPIGKNRIEAEFVSSPDRFVMFPYTSPQGKTYYCHNSCLCDATVRILKRGLTGWKVVDSLHAQRTAAAEFCTPKKVTPETFTYRGLHLPILHHGR